VTWETQRLSRLQGGCGWRTGDGLNSDADGNKWLARVQLPSLLTTNGTGSQDKCFSPTGVRTPPRRIS